MADAEPTAQSAEIHATSDGTYGSPRVHEELQHRQVACGRGGCGA
jgi:hypothetical protein